MKLGVCYYPEHWPPERWPQDARLMAAAGLDYVRIGEFAWQQMEPAEGRFDWDWLDRAIDTLAAEGLRLILGTPTAAPPAWLCAAHPDILPVDSQGRRRRFGSRRHYCPNSPDFQAHSRRIVAAMAARYGRHSAVIGWQIDNEFGCHDTARCYCPHCAAAFRRWLRTRYGALDHLNRAWGTVFWSQVYDDWEQIEPPILTVAEPNPSQVLDYWRFSSASYVAYQQLQIDLLQEHTSGQFITTNFMGTYPDLDYHALARPLDFVTWDSYPTGYAERNAPALYRSDEARPVFAHDVGDPYVTGFCHDLTRGLKQAPFWVMEQQAGHINWGAVNPGVRPGAVRLWTWHALASGAEAVVYFRWRACLYGHEIHHSGLLEHDASPDVGYGDILSMAGERDLMAAIAASPLEPAPIALLLDYDNLWAVQSQPHRRDFGYLRHLFTFYRAARQLGLAVDIVPPDADLSPYRLVAAPTQIFATPAQVAALENFVQGGGHLLLGVRSGFKTPANTATDAPLPGVFRTLAGATVTAWHSLPDGVSYPLASSLPGLSGGAGFWAEALKPDEGGAGAAIVRFAGGPFADMPALTANTVGRGRCLYLGFYPDVEQAKALLAHLSAEIGLRSPVASLPGGVIACQRGPYLMLLNFDDAERVVQMEPGAHAHRSVTVAPRSVHIVPLA